MATKNLSVRLRPLRIGMLVNEGSIAELVQAAEIGTLLYGGVYNPVLPISEDNSLSELILDVFKVDILVAVGQSRRIDEFLQKFRYLSDPYYMPLFHEDYNTKRNRMSYLDSINALGQLMEKQPGPHQESLLSDFVLPRWSPEDPSAGLFSVWFGHFPSNLNLEDNFEVSYLTATRPQQPHILPEDRLAGYFTRSKSPITSTGLGLSSYARTERNMDGIYVGYQDDFADLSLFWNLRAAGLGIQFLPIGSVERFVDVATAHLAELDNVSDDPPGLRLHHPAYCRNQCATEVASAISGLETSKGVSPFPVDNRVIWNGLNLEAVSHSFASTNVLADLENSSEGYVLAFSLPDKTPVQRNGRDSLQAFAFPLCL